MTTAASPGVQSETPPAEYPRMIRLVRVAVLLAAGMFIAFTATQHELLGFDISVTAIAIAAIGCAHFAAWVAARSRGGSPTTLLLGIAAIAAAVALPLTASTGAYAIVVAAWALASALLEFLTAVMRPEARQDATLAGAAGILLAILTLLVREDPVAILGFFGAYAVIVGVFHGISAFDSRGAAATPVVSAQTDSPS